MKAGQRQLRDALAKDAGWLIREGTALVPIGAMLKPLSQPVTSGLTQRERHFLQGFQALLLGKRYAATR